jgi:hypothetical protein
MTIVAPDVTIGPNFPPPSGLTVSGAKPLIVATNGYAGLTLRASSGAAEAQPLDAYGVPTRRGDGAARAVGDLGALAGAAYRERRREHAAQLHVSEEENPDQVVRETIRLRVPCRCGEVAVMELSPEQARRTAAGLLAAAAGLDRLELDVRGSG